MHSYSWSFSLPLLYLTYRRWHRHKSHGLLSQYYLRHKRIPPIKVFLYLLSHPDLSCGLSSIRSLCEHRHVDQLLHQLQVLRIRNYSRVGLAIIRLDMVSIVVYVLEEGGKTSAITKHYTPFHYRPFTGCQDSQGIPLCR